MPFYLGIDIGHTKIKAGLFDDTGAAVRLTSRHTPTDACGIPPTPLWESVAACIRCLLAESGADSAEIRAIACSGHGNGLYLLDADGRPLSQAYAATFDGAQGVVDALTDTPALAALCEYTCQRLWAGQPLPILRYLKQERPKIYERVARICFCKDYINYCLCGQLATEYTDAGAAGLLNIRTGDYDDRIFAVFDLPQARAMVPPLKRSTDIVGCVTPEAAQQTGLAVGTPVAAGLFDAAAAFLGAGMYGAGDCGMVSGTWGINAAVADTLPAQQHFLQCVPYMSTDSYLYIESAPTSSVNLEWLLTQVFPDMDYRTADEIAARFAPDEVAALYQPYIYNAEGGGFCRLTHRDTKESMLRAVYEGVAFGHRRQWEALTDSGITPETILFIGGATNSAVWCQIFADVLGTPLWVPTVSDAGMLGNVMVAAAAVGQFASPQQACDALRPVYRQYYPQVEHTAAYEQKYQVFKSLL